MMKLNIKIIITAILVITFIIFLSLNKNKLSQPALNSIDERALGEKEITADSDALKDTDGDGLKDWQEKLWQTNPKEVDTDGDGTSDGSEVSQNRDPRKKPPDLITEEVARELFETQLKTNPVLDTDKKIGTIVSLPIKNNKASPLRDYGNLLGSILQTHATLTADEGKIIVAVLSKPGADDFERLKVIGSAYQTTAYKISLLKAPNDATDIHQKLEQSYNKIGLAMEKISSYKNSPIPSGEFETYNAAVLENAESLNNLLKLFSKNNVMFGAGEAGRIFTMGI